MPVHRPFSRTPTLRFVVLVALTGAPGTALSAQSTVPARDAPPAPPATCVAGTKRGMGAVSGRRISEVDIVSRGPANLPAVGAPLHTTTRDATLRSRLLFAVGDTVDTLAIAESVRQLRRLRYLVGAVVKASCDEAGGVVLTVATRDAWSLKPRVSARGSSGTAGLEETNLLGTGRALRLYVRSDRGQVGVGAGYSDPALFGARAIGTMSHDTYRDGGTWTGTLRSRDLGAFERLGFEAAAGKSARRSVTSSASSVSGDTVRRAQVSLLVRRRLAYEPSAATYLLAGVEGERTVLVAGADLPLAGPSSVRRTFAGLDLGLGRRAGRYDAVPWLLPRSGDEGAQFAPAEIPVGTEGQGIVGMGRDFATLRPMSHVDLWAGRIWHLGTTVENGDDDDGIGVPRALLSSDLWASGYRALGAGRGEWSAGAIRGSLALAAPARRGLWSARLSGERLADPDPDVRSLAMSDPVLRAIPSGSRLAETAMSASIERSVHVFGARHGYVLDGALFGAGSMRWDGAARRSLADRAGAGADPASEPAGANEFERLYVASVGLGLRLVPTRFGRSTLGLEVGVPVSHSPQLRGRPYVGVSITPAFGSGRRRDGAAP